MRVELAVPIPFSELCECGAVAIFRRSGSFKYITTDSREALSGDLFIGINGENYSDTDFIADAAEKGAVTVSSGSKSDYRTENTRELLLRLAERYKSRLTELKHTVAITGSIGKTTTKDFSRAIIGTSYRAHSTHGNQNNDIGLPLTILSAPRDTEALILECGMNHRGEIKRLSECAHPDVAIITNIGTAHIGMLGSRVTIAKEKLDITSGNKDCYLICPDNEPLLFEAHNRIAVGTSESADLKYELKELSCGEYRLLLCDTLGIKHRFCFRLAAKQVIIPLLLSLALGVFMGIDDALIQKGLDSVNENFSRCRTLELPRYKIIDDAYNASPESVIGALGYLRSLEGQYHSALLGDILELGDFSRDMHERVGEECAKAGLSRLFIWGKFAHHIYKGALRGGMPEKRITVINADTAEEVADIIDNSLLRGEIILIKGSHATGLYKIGDYLRRLCCE